MEPLNYFLKIQNKANIIDYLFEDALPVRIQFAAFYGLGKRLMELALEPFSAKAIGAAD